MKTTQEILAQLERLEVQVKMAKNLVFSGNLVTMSKADSFTTSPNTFRVGDFVVTDMMWNQEHLWTERMWTVSGDEFERINQKLDAELIEEMKRDYTARRLLMACLDTGILRCDTYRQLYEEVCKFVGIEPK